MGTGVSSGVRRVFGAISAALVFVGFGVSLSGCPVAAELENPDRFAIFGQSGAAGSGSVDCSQALPDGPNVIGCDYDRLVRDHCARGGCHNPPGDNYIPAAQLTLTPDPFLIARILEVPSKHIITCTGLGQCNLSDPQCDDCRMCSTVDLTDRLLTKANIPGSWIIQKMEAFNPDTPTVVPEIGCGYAMPLAPGNTIAGGFTAAKRTCLTNFFTWIANNGTPCDVSAGGSGGGGAGGAGAGGAGSGGTGGT